MKLFLCVFLLVSAAEALPHVFKQFDIFTTGDGRGFASYGAPMHSFGGLSGGMDPIGYGPPTGPHLLYKRSTDSVAKRDVNLPVFNAVRSLLYRNDTMCLGLAVCQEAREDPKSASLLKGAFNATKFLQGVNFVQYAVAQAGFPRETCEQAFRPCDVIQPTLRKALANVKLSMKMLPQGHPFLQQIPTDSSETNN